MGLYRDYRDSLPPHPLRANPPEPAASLFQLSEEENSSGTGIRTTTQNAVKSTLEDPKQSLGAKMSLESYKLIANIPKNRMQPSPKPPNPAPMQPSCKWPGVEPQHRDRFLRSRNADVSSLAPGGPNIDTKNTVVLVIGPPRKILPNSRKP